MEEKKAQEEQATTNHKTNTLGSNEIVTASHKQQNKVVPEDILKRYVKVGDKYYQHNNTKLIAFEDKGSRLETKADSATIVQSLVQIAEARGWGEIKASGTERFRREVWLEAASRGMSVKGYKPTEHDKAELATRLNGTKVNAIASPKHDFRAPENPNEEVYLVAHGAAKYQHDENNSNSYYVTVRDNKEREQTLWGVDLERAIVESGAKAGDKIAIAYEGKKKVTVVVPIRNDKGEVTGEREIQTHRNSWNVKMAEAFATKSPEEAVKKYPELAGAAAAISAIEKKIEADGLTPEQRTVVMNHVQEKAMNSISRGAIPQVKVRKEVQRQKQVDQDQELSL